MSSTVDRVPHHLVGTAEIAQMLGGVSRQYVDQLSRREDFPEPEVELASGRVWKREAILEWARTTGREVRG